MKKRSVFLGLIAVAMAVGTAFASLRASTDIYAEVYMTQLDEINDIPTCLNTEATCDDTGGTRCKVQLNVQKPGASNITSASFQSDCSTPVFQIGSDVSVSSQAPWSLVSPD